MAIKVTREVVCDLGDNHKGDITHWRLTTERETQVFDLCPACSKPLQTLWDRGNAHTPVPARLKVHSMSEVEARKQK